MRIGVDVGGTNTDAVLMSGRQICAAVKASTTADVTGGIIDALARLLAQANISPNAVQCVMIGTTHFTNALIERSHLMDVGIIRIALPAASSLPPLSGWPDDLRAMFAGNVFQVPGGYNYDGREIAPFSEEAVIAVAKEISRRKLPSVAISCVFSPAKDDMELRCARIVRKCNPDARITLSSKVGRIGFLERENATILNAALRDLSSQVVQSFAGALETLKIKAPFYISQNDGTPMLAEIVEEFPVLTIASGPTNSMRGAAFLTGTQNAIVIDIGGTTSDLGVITNGFPRESSVSVDIGGVRTNFRMPDILAIGLGGGSLVTAPDGKLSLGGKVSIGPQSVGLNLKQKAKVFGGDVLTVTDIAVAGGLIDAGNIARLSGLDSGLVESALAEAHLRLEDAVDRVKMSAQPIPVILVGGARNIVHRPLRGCSELITPEYGSVANAIGAAIGQVGGEVEKVYDFDSISRETAVAEASLEACARSRRAGAMGNIHVVNIEETPLAYASGQAVRLKVKAVGDLDLQEASSLVQA